MARKIKQIAVVTDSKRDYVYSLCEDGTVWKGCYQQYTEKDGTKKLVWLWDEIPGVPDTKSENFYNSDSAEICPSCRGSGAMLESGVSIECVYCGGSGKLLPEL